VTPDRIVERVISNARLEGYALSEETIAVVRRIAQGVMTGEEIKAWRQQRVIAMQAEARSLKID
jgi:hypothetical protein